MVSPFFSVIFIAFNDIFTYLFSHSCISLFILNKLIVSAHKAAEPSIIFLKYPMHSSSFHPKTWCTLPIIQMPTVQLKFQVCYASNGSCSLDMLASSIDDERAAEVRCDDFFLTSHPQMDFISVFTLEVFTPSCCDSSDIIWATVVFICNTIDLWTDFHYVKSVELWGRHTVWGKLKHDCCKVLLNQLLITERKTLHLYFTIASVIINTLLPPCLDWSVAGGGFFYDSFYPSVQCVITRTP